MRLLIIATILTLLSPTAGETSNLANNESDILYLTSYFEEQDWGIDTFSITFREKMTPQEYGQFEKWEDNRKSLNTFEDNPHKNAHINETSKSINLNGHKELIQVIYTISGDQWDEETKQKVLNITQETGFSRLFENSPVYTCFETKFSGSISSNLLKKKLINEIDINQQHLIEENHFIVIEGWTDRIKSSVQNKHSNTNIQLALRQEGDHSTTLTIGTPILVIEY
ncbi:hypothetical protein CEY16_07445 [Halalkalibacillus sediminis]|uniref:TATA-box binding n=1 Tax=Halalkalibacillus sediminis TaxID=2018042 RepID=A0A2I0QTT9_9BACI|nr:YwmB family TATA-box binding protein [Halalkalibacillus sediminis]PKR77757.1 hypothetical protein CEY16_07445 [Halalkalibacillus sediminis]